MKTVINKSFLILTGLVGSISLQLMEEKYVAFKNKDAANLNRVTFKKVKGNSLVQCAARCLTTKWCNGFTFDQGRGACNLLIAEYWSTHFMKSGSKTFYLPQSLIDKRDCRIIDADVYGRDIQVITNTPDPDVCEQKCKQDSRCLAWLSLLHEESGYCYLKSKDSPLSWFHTKNVVIIGHSDCSKFDLGPLNL